MKYQLTSSQNEIINHEDGPLLVLAGPGSGKTFVLTERIRRLLTEIEGNFKILALTFTNKAAKEMKERLSEFPKINQKALVGTLHSFCVEVLANRGQSEGFNGLPVIFESIEDRKQILLQVIKDDIQLTSILRKSLNNMKQDKLLNKWLEQISCSKNNLIPSELIDDPILKKVYDGYNSRLRNSNAIDFDDLLFYTYRLFQNRPKIAEFYQRQYRYICIDEGQDLNEAQYRVILALCRNNYKNVMIVGDPNQAIFVWNGASPKYMKQFEQDFKPKKVIIKENFRSSQAIINIAKKLIPNYQTDGIYPIKGHVKLNIGQNEKNEAELVLNEIIKLSENSHPDLENEFNFNRCAILGRTRYVLHPFKEILKSKNIPFYLYLSSQYESETEIMKDYSLCLKILNNYSDLYHRDILLKKWNISLQFTNSNLTNTKNGIDFFSNLINHLKEPQLIVVNAILELKYTENNIDFLNSIEFLSDYSEKINNENEKELFLLDINLWKQNWNQFVRSTRGGEHSLGLFLNQIALGCTQPISQEGIALLTIHSAKGLEFDVVFVCGLCEGSFPDYRTTDYDEERRNAFVAITRAKRLLYFSYPKVKIMPWGKKKTQYPSRYLKDIGLL